MLFNYLLGIYCFFCKKYYNPYTETYLNVLYENSISCEKDHLIGNIRDLEWQEYFYNYNCPHYYIYHNKGQCRCVQEDTNCEGLVYNCDNYYGKKVYEDDLKEQNDKSN